MGRVYWVWASCFVAGLPAKRQQHSRIKTIAYEHARTIAALERSIAQLTTIKDRLSVVDAKASCTPAKKSAAKKTAVKRMMTPEHKANISAAKKKRFSLAKSPVKKGAAKGPPDSPRVVSRPGWQLGIINSTPRDGDHV